MLNTRPGPPNQVSVHPPLSQILTGTETSIIRRISSHGDYPTKPSSIPTSYHDSGLETVAHGIGRSPAMRRRCTTPRTTTWSLRISDSPQHGTGTYAHV